MLSILNTFNSDLSAWNITSVTNISHMFNNARAFNSDLSAWAASDTTHFIEALLHMICFERENVFFLRIIYKTIYTYKIKKIQKPFPYFGELHIIQSSKHGLQLAIEHVLYCIMSRLNGSFLQILARGAGLWCRGQGVGRLGSY